MEERRFDKFILLIEGLHKCINKAKVELSVGGAVKGVHIFWLYELLQHPEGLTATEIATASRIDRSLVSREIALLKKEGYVLSEQEGAGRGYNCRIRLSERGQELARSISGGADEFQKRVGAGISHEELCSFYKVLEIIYNNFDAITRDRSESLDVKERKRKL